MGILDEYPTGYYDTPAAPGLTLGSGLLADPVDTGFGQMSPFGGLLTSPAPAAAPTSGGIFGGLFGGGEGGGGGEPMDWRSLLMSAGAGLLKSNGRIEGLGEGIMGGLRLGAQTAGNRQIAAMRGLQMQKLQKDMANEERLDSSWQRSIEEAEKIRNFVASPVPPIVAPTGEQFAEVPPAGPQTPGFASNMPILSAGGGADMPPLGGSQAAAVQAPPKPSNPFVAALVSMPADHFGFIRGAGRTKGEQIAMNFFNKEAGDKFETVDPRELGLPEGSIAQRNVRSGKVDVVSRGDAPKTITVDGRVFLQNRDGSLGRDLGSSSDPNGITMVNGEPWRNSDLLRLPGGGQPVPDQRAQPAPASPSGAPAGPMMTPAPSLMRSVWNAESSNNPAAVGPPIVDAAGNNDPGIGIGQVRSQAATDVAKAWGRGPFTREELTDPKLGPAISQEYMKQMLRWSNGNAPLAVAAYHAGTGNMQTWMKSFGDPRNGQGSVDGFLAQIPAPLTRNYVAKVMSGAGESAPVQTMPAPQRGGVQVAGGPQPLMRVPKDEPGVAVKDDATGRTVLVPRSQSFGREPGGEDKTFEQVKDLRHEFFKVSAPFIARRDSLNNMIAANRKDPSGADDIALVFGFMKMLDPASVVRENEQASAQNAGGVIENVRNIYNGLLTGQKLPEQVRIDFMKQARSQYDRAYQQHRENENIFRGLAKSNKFDPEQVVPDLSSAAARERAKEDLAQQKAADEAALVIAEQRAMLSARSEGAAAKNLPPAAPAPAPAPNPAATMVPMRQPPAEAPRGSAVQVPIQAMGAGGAMPPPAVPQQVERPPMRLPPGPMTGIAPYPGTAADRLPSFSRPDDPALLALPPGTPFWGIRPDGSRVRKVVPGAPQ